MPGPARIERPDDPRLADYRDLTDTVLRRRTEPEHGMFIAEGELVLQRAVRGGHSVRSLLLLDSRLPLLGDLVAGISSGPLLPTMKRQPHEGQTSRGPRSSPLRRSWTRRGIESKVQVAKSTR